jgi:hypothetical protein
MQDMAARAAKVERDIAAIDLEIQRLSEGDEP